MEDTEGEGLMPVLRGSDLLADLPLPAGVSEIEVKDWKTVPSSHLRVKDVIDLAKLIRELSQSFDGIVVVQGTDTLEEISYMIDLLYGGSAPVVFTGAMYPPRFIGSDAKRNLFNAIRVASCFDAIGQGALVVMNDEVHSAVEVIKLKSFGVDAFSSLPFGPIGVITPKGVEFRRKLLKREFYETEDLEEKVALVKTCFSMNPDTLDLFISSGYKGIVLEAMGCGNVPPVLVPSIREAIRNGIPVVLSSRCSGSDIVPIYGYEGGSLYLVREGVISAGRLNGLKARIKLMVLLGITRDLEELKERFS
ncbi:MAG: asparaginase [Synergistetes bacterium]|nr:asparaginase [Synergistota bacterium]